MVSNNVKKLAFRTAVLGLLFGTPSCTNGDDNGQNRKTNKTEVPAKKKKQKPSLKTKYKINTRADFDKLYADAAPFIFMSMIPTENWREDFHDDRQRKNAVPNSVGVGLYYVGVNKSGALDFSSKGWKKTKTYAISYRNKHGGKNPPNLKPTQLYDGTRGWFENMDNGRHLNELFQYLKGAELTINEFAAIASVYYNSETLGKQVCNYVRNNYKKPRQCAQYIVNTAAKMGGIKPRRVHETLVYLNHKGYCQNMYSLEVDGYLGTSVSGITAHYTALKQGITDAKLDAASHAIYTHAVKNGHPIRYYAQKIGGNYQEDLLAFAEQSSVTREMDQRGEQYALAMQKYNAKDYTGALALFKQIVKENGNSADLYNDMAITYYHLGQYEQCIAQCQEVLKTGEREKYMFGTYNAGLAYWALKNYDKAISNFNAAIKYAKEFGETENQKIYEKKLAQCKQEKNAARGVKPKSTPQKGVQKAPQKKQTPKKNTKQNLKNGTRKIHALMMLDAERKKAQRRIGDKQYT